ncbi:TPA: hypothetical protein N0F65_009566 [Lagenidium giganteum]|uniref:Nuclear transport factor 2 family protein n=1 Tax=Lagenidium giganteum TaxID=4803 RepID=A0AAV2YNE6_9STRA|nr:TPA: hypothetical protein N0F65_009566 [Lagenidium giganteum]
MELDTLTNEHVEIVAKYFASRLEKKTAELLELVSEDIESHSARDGTYKGKESFKKYIEKVKPEGKWENPVLSEDNRTVIMRGVVKILFVSVTVKSAFTFNKDNKICKINTSKA